MLIQMKTGKQEMAAWILEIEVSICGLAFYREVGTIKGDKMELQEYANMIA